MWLNKSKYLHAVTGQQIVDEQAKLHTATSFVVATQPILLMPPERNEIGLRLYDAFIYYKVSEKFILCPKCNKKIHIDDFAAVTKGQGVGKEDFWHSDCIAAEMTKDMKVE